MLQMQVVFGNKSETKRKFIDIISDRCHTISERGDDMTDIRYISTKEAAEIMGLSTRRVVGLCGRCFEKRLQLEGSGHFVYQTTKIWQNPCS